LNHRVVSAAPVALRIGRGAGALVAAFGFAVLACSHPSTGGPITGNAGTTGAAGVSPTGSAGTGAGVAGTTGSAGDSGGAGTTGDAGTTGNAGTTGTAGTSGAAGTSGTAGTSGSAGTTGTAGTSGTGGDGSTGTGGSSPANNLIANGDFSGGATNWHTEGGTGNVNGSGAYCVTNPGAALIGWDAPAGSPLMLSSGKSYRISYQASGAGTIHLKVGMASSPFGDIYTADDGIGGSLQTYTHNFTPTASNNAGLAFTFSNAGTATVCVDNVTLVAN
jgi:hypothetical protein